IQLGGNDRFRARDWLMEEINAGRLTALQSHGDDTEPLRKWVDDILYAGDEWVDARLRQWVDSKVAEWSKAQSAGSQEPTEREAARERARVLGDKRAMAMARAELAQEYAVSAKSVGRRNGHDAAAGQDWFDATLREEAQDWLRDAGRTWS